MRVTNRIGALVAAAVVGSVLTVTAAAPPATAVAPPPPVADPQPDPVASTTHFPPKPDAPTDHTDPAWLAPRAVTVPVPGAAVAAVATSGRTRAGTLPVSVGRAASGLVPASVRVRVLSQPEVAAAGGRFLGFELTRADGGASPALASLTVDYGAFAAAYGADLASRLRLVRVTDCVPDAPCTPTQVPATNDLTARTLTVTGVPVEPDPAAALTGAETVATAPSEDSGFGPQVVDETSAISALAPSGGATTFAMTTAASGPDGDFGATPLNGSDKWDVGVGSGALTYSYPIALPPPPAGDAPALSLDYSSQAVDGRTSAANGQAPQVGEGWSFEPGYIERRFHSCSGENGRNDLCWTSLNEYYLHFGGHSGLLVNKAGTNEWRITGNDPGWRIRSFNGGNNGDAGGSTDTGEYFVLFLPDGTKYWFGYGTEPRNTTTTFTKSAYTVPVVGGPGEPCHTTVASTSWCQQAYRWNVDRILDTDDNVATLFYANETNKYAVNASAALSTTYVRAGYLSRIEYGQHNGGEGDPTPAQVTVAVQDRCAAQTSCPAVTSTSTAYPDVPVDKICTATCSATDQDMPTFFSTKQVNSVTASVRTRSGTSPSYTYAYTDVATYAMTYSFPTTADTSSPSLWLKDITKTGKVGTDIALPPVRFDGIAKPNRRNSGAGVPSMNKYRIEQLRTELGAHLVVTYGTPDLCAANTVLDAANNDTDCFPAWYDPHDGVTTPGWVPFVKYLVTQLVTTDERGSDPTLATTTHYSYLDTPAWHYDDSPRPDPQTWSDYRGHSSVRVVVDADGASAGTDTRYKVFRGMDSDRLTATTTKNVSLTDVTGDTYPDTYYLSGLTLQSVRLLDDRATELQATVHQYTGTATAPNTDGIATHSAYFARETTTDERVHDLSGGTTYRHHVVRTTYDGATGQPLTTSDDGMPGDASDDTCTKTDYTTNTTTGAAGADTMWLVDRPFRTMTYKGACGSGSVVVDAKTELFYDGAASLTATPSRGDLTATYAYNTSSHAAITQMTYDPSGRILTVTPPNEAAKGAGATPIQTAYVPSTGYPYDGVSVTDQLGHLTKTVPFVYWGTPSKAVDANGQITTVTADALGRTTAVSRPGDVTGVPSLTVSYQVALAVPNRVLTKRLLSGTTYVAAYSFLDGFGREVQRQSPKPNGVDAAHYTVAITRYDGAGHQASVSEPMNADGTMGAAFAAPASIPLETRYGYDPLGRVRRVTKYVGGVPKIETTTTYSGLSQTVQAPVRSAVDYDTDVFGRTTRVVEHPAVGTAVTTYGYTPLGDLESIVDDSGNTTTYGYDMLRRRVTSHDPDQGTWTTAYDNEGHVTTVTDAKNATLRNAYDGLGRRTSIAKVNTPSPDTTLATWSYDGGIANGVGRLASSTRLVGGASYTSAVSGYDVRGRPTGRAWTVPFPSAATTYAYTYGYDAADHLVSVGYPAAGTLAAETVTTGFNNAGLPTTLTSGLADGNYVTGTTYGDDGRIASRTIGRGTSPAVVRTYTYDNVGRLGESKSALGGAAPFDDVTYGYDLASNVTSVVDPSAQGTAPAPQRECFTYDPLNRLTAAATTTAATCTSPDGTTGADPYRLAYTYDDLGNMTGSTAWPAAGGTPTTQTYEYNLPGGTGGPHAVESIHVAGGTPTIGYTYDANGATRSRPGTGATSLTWDDLHQLAGAVTSTGTTTFVYDADGNRLVRDTGTTKTLYLDGMEVASAAGGLTATRYYGSVALRTSGPSGAASRTVLLRNQQNSASISVSEAGAFTRQRYLPYGARRGSAASLSTDRGFLDKTEDVSTGLDAVGARYYDAQIGRFISVDPLADLSNPQSLAGYSYGLDNPTSLVDPSGLVAVEPGGSCQNMVGNCPKAAPPPGSDPSEGTRQATQATTAEYHKVIVRAIAAVRHLNLTKEKSPDLYYDQMRGYCMDEPQNIGPGGCEQSFRVAYIADGIKPSPGVLDWLTPGLAIVVAVLTLGQSLDYLLTLGIDADAVAAESTLVADAEEAAATADIGPTTLHGAERIAGEGAGRGGTLSPEKIIVVREDGEVWQQAAGGVVRVLKNGTGRFDVVVDGDAGLITTFENLGQKSLDRLAANYGWTK
jgi:RHS repeat-associated protein